MANISDDEPNAKRTPRGLFERPKGSGVWWVRYHDEHGKEHREKVGPKSLALKVYQKRKNEVQERRFFPERIRRREVLFADMADDVLARVVKQPSYKEHQRASKIWKVVFKRKSLREITTGDIERYVATRVGQVAPATINRQLAFLKRLFNLAIADGKTETNPVRAIKFFKENNRRLRYLTDTEEDALRREVGETEWPKVAVALHTGFRRRNVFTLRWTDVNFETGMITARNPKGGEDYHVPMTHDLRAILRDLPSRLKSEWVFPNAIGTGPKEAQNFRHYVFDKALTRAKIAGFRWHDLRHTFASRLAMKGVDLFTIQELMGHKSPEMTQRYAHLSPQHRAQAIQLLNRPASTGTTTGTTVAAEAAVAEGGAQVRALRRKSQRARGESNTQPTDSKSAALSN